MRLGPKRPAGRVPYTIAPDERVLEALRRALGREPVVESQHRLARLVRDELARDVDEWRVSEERVRRLALESGLAVLTVVTGTTDRPAPQVCPVCGSDLERVRNRTLAGEEAVVGTRCPRCPYRSGSHHEVPLRYGFMRAFEPAAANGTKGPF